MKADTQRKLLETKRELEMARFKSRFVTLGWALIALTTAGDIYGAVVKDPGILAALIIVAMAGFGLGVASFSDEFGVYVAKRKLRWEIEDLTQQYATEIMEG